MKKILLGLILSILYSLFIALPATAQTDPYADLATWLALPLCQDMTLQQPLTLTFQETTEVHYAWTNEPTATARREMVFFTVGLPDQRLFLFSVLSGSLAFDFDWQERLIILPAQPNRATLNTYSLSQNADYNWFVVFYDENDNAICRSENSHWVRLNLQPDALPQVCGSGEHETLLLPCGLGGDGREVVEVAQNADLCLLDPAKTDPGACGCGVPDVDDDGNDSITDENTSNNYVAGGNYNNTGNCGVANTCNDGTDTITDNVGGTDSIYGGNGNAASSVGNDTGATGDTINSNDGTNDVVFTGNQGGGSGTDANGGTVTGDTADGGNNP